jgi:hypothetical protein
MNKLIVNMIMALCLFVPNTHANNTPQPSSTSYWTGSPYQRNQQDSVDLSIPGTDFLDIKIEGRSKLNQDVLRIYYDKRRRHESFSGIVNETITVPGDSVRVTFNSQGTPLKDGSFRVTIHASSPYTQFKKMEARLEAALNNISANGAQHAEQEVLRNIQTFREIYEQLKDSKDPLSLATKISQALSDVSESYARISGMRASVRANNAVQLAELSKVLEETRAYAEQLGQRQRNAEDQYQADHNNLKKETDALAQKKLEFALRAQNSLIESMRAQQRSWLDFAVMQEKIREKMESYSQSIDLLLYVLEINSQVYREAAHAMQLRHNIDVALRALEGLSDLQEVLAVITDTWRDVLDLRAQIRDIHSR